MRMNGRSLKALGVLLLVLSTSTGSVASQRRHKLDGKLQLSRAEYLDRAQAIWMAQMIGQRTGLLFEHLPASVLKDTPLLSGKGFAEIDDDYYYEMVAIRAFEK